MFWYAICRPSSSGRQSLTPFSIRRELLTRNKPRVSSVPLWKVESEYVVRSAEAAVSAASQFLQKYTAFYFFIFHFTSEYYYVQIRISVNGLLA